MRDALRRCARTWGRAWGWADTKGEAPARAKGKGSCDCACFREVALAVAYLSFRLLTLFGSIYIAMKLAYFEYSALGSSSAETCSVLMILGALVALWVESVVPYMLTAARLPDIV